MKKLAERMLWLPQCVYFLEWLQKVQVEAHGWLLVTALADARSRRRIFFCF